MTNKNSTMEKITHRDFYNALATLVEQNHLATENITSEMFAEFLADRLAQLDKRNAYRKPKAVSEADSLTEQAMLDFISSNPGQEFKASDLAKQFDLSSTQKATAILTRLVEAGQIERNPKKKTVHAVQ